MNELWGFQPAPERDEEKTVFVDPTLGVDTRRERWEARAAQWRARHVAELVFGGDVEARLSGRGRPPFRGLLELDVPFTDLSTHREREAVFLACVARDPLLASVPFIYVIGPAAQPTPELVRRRTRRSRRG
jgi:hypothetical protein